MREPYRAVSDLNQQKLWRWLGVLLIGVAALARAESATAPSVARGPRLDPIADVAVPPLEARVTDLTGTLSASQQAALEQKLRDYEERKGSQIAVLLVPTTQPETIEQYSIRVVDKWKLGRKDVDDGVLLLVAMQDRQARIEVGRGLEGALPDVIAKRIIVDIVRPRFRQGDFYGGIDAGVDTIISTIEGEPLPAPTPAPSGESGGGNLETAMGIAFFVALVGGGLMRRLFGRLLGATVTGVAVVGIIWLITQALLVALFLGIVMFVFTIAVGLSGFGGFGPGGIGPGGWGGGWTSGGWGGGLGGGGGGGFSGGGGGFGGGGASGSW